MRKVSEYLSSSYHEDRRELATLRTLIENVLTTLALSFDDKNGWPYEIPNRGGGLPASISHSTTSMVLSALALLFINNTPAAADEEVTNALPYTNADSMSNTVLKFAMQTYYKATELLFSDVCGSKDEVLCTRSPTFGDNDPITGSYFARLVAHRGLVDQSTLSLAKEFLSAKAETLLAQTDIASTTHLWSPKEYAPIPNAIIPLRCVRLIGSVAEWNPNLDLGSLRAYRDFFETVLHDNLSFFSIPDSRFDPAELAFCLEGLLRSQKEIVDFSLFKRVIEVMRQAQVTKRKLAADQAIFGKQQGRVAIPNHGRGRQLTFAIV